MKKKYRWCRSALAISLACAMTVTSLNGTSLNVYAAIETQAAQSDIKYLDFEKLDQSDFTDGVDVKVTYKGQNATITGKDWGNDWGDNDSKWQIQLKQLVPVTKGEKYTVSVTFVSKVNRDIFVKLGDANVDETVYGEDVISLKANEPYVYTKTTNANVDIDQMMVLFALGAAGKVGTTQNTIKINNFSVKGDKSGYVKQGEVDSSIGKEHDFTSSKGDYADPGTSKTGYDLIWADEFDGNYGSDKVDKETGLDLNNWAYQLGDGTTDCGNTGWGNNELECYTSNKKNIAVNEDVTGDGKKDGYLRITASYEDKGYTYQNETTKKYTSARIRTTTAKDALFNTTYGYIESRMALPGTKGAWPAFWMLPQSTDIYKGWPVSGEIDIMETCGAFANGADNQACSTLHWGNPEHVYKGSGYTALSSDYTNFHTYGVDWEPGKMTFYYDGKPIYTSENWESGFAGASDSLAYDAPYDQPFYMLLNLAVDSGQFGGAVNKAEFKGDINMYVDYVRVYQKTEGYAESVKRTASGDAKADWEKYKGINQIADLTDKNLESVSFAADNSADSSKWYLSYNANNTGGKASIDAYKDANNKTWAKIGVSEAGSQDYSVQMIGHYDAKAGYLYKVSFDAFADGNIVGKTVNCDSKEWNGWSTYGITSFDLTDKATSYSYYINQTDDFNKCRIEFNLGAKDTGNIYIGNVKVEIVDPSLISSEKERTPLSNGNVIYNGSFDQGIDRVGYWNASEGTSLSVPRYTTEALKSGDLSVVDVASKINKSNSKIYVKDGVKYYERRAQISAAGGTTPQIYQAGLTLPKDTYTMDMDMYSAKATTFKASIYTVDVQNKDGKQVETLGKEVASKNFKYESAGRVDTFSWKLNLKNDIENAAFVLTFADGSSVQIDNVSLKGASLGDQVDPTPMGDKITWTADQCTLKINKGVATVKNLVNGDAWYASQAISSNYSLTAGNTYKLSFKYKLSGTSNKTVKYIIQENGGSWTVYGNGPTAVKYDSKKADADGFCTYTATIPANVSLKNVHMVFGFGHSEVGADTVFQFKNVKMVLNKTSNADSTGKITGVKSSYTVKANAKAFTLKAKGVGKVTYISSNSKVAAVNAKTGKVTVKAPGIAKITIKAAGNDKYSAAKKTVTIKVVPKQVSVTSAKSSKKAVTTSWKKDVQASGYEIQYSTDKNFKNAKTLTVGKNTTTSKSISNLKSGKEYYVRVRSYKKSGKTKLSGGWSKTVKVTVK